MVFDIYPQPWWVSNLIAKTDQTSGYQKRRENIFLNILLFMLFGTDKKGLKQKNKIWINKKACFYKKATFKVNI